MFKIYCPVIAFLVFVTSANIKCQSQEENDDDEINRNNGSSVNYVIAKFGSGLIRGRVSYSAGPHRPSHVFLGIPFAEAPVKALRWRQLKPKNPWLGVLEATKYRAACPSNSTETTSPQKYISEDCIYANVFADPKCKHQKHPCPILFYIHGGGFRYDSATMFNETQIVQKYASDGVIFVIAAYRLGVFGFLDLGDESVVKKNLGIYDIVFALRWTKRELPKAVGGDPNRITIMGNSAGANAVILLCTSPLVYQQDFHQAFVSSGMTYLASHGLNLSPSFAIVKHFNCGFFRNSIKVLECLRKIPAMELLREQQKLEISNQTFQGPSGDGLLLSGRDSIEQLKHWKPRPLIITATLNEFFNLDKGETEKGECVKAMVAFGLQEKSVFEACMERYHQDFKLNVPMGASYESYHANAVLTAIINKNRGATSYVGSFELANFTRHSKDMYFFFGLHWIPINTPAEKLMDLYYPKFVKEFLKKGRPDFAWRGVDSIGRNYFVLDFKVAPNGTQIQWPYFVEGNYSDPAAVDFWLNQMPKLEARSRLNKRSISTINLRNKAEFPFEILLATNTSDLMTNGAQRYEISSENFSTTFNVATPTYEYERNKLPKKSEFSSEISFYGFADAWATLWMILSIATLMLLIYFIIVITRSIYRIDRPSGYFYVNKLDGIGNYFFTEHSPLTQKSYQQQHEYLSIS